MSVAKQWIDPFDGMSDDEFDAHVDALFAERPRTVGVSLRMAPDLLERVKRQAGQAGIPYQTFVKSILEAAVTRLEQHAPAPPTARLTAKLTAKPADIGGRRRTLVESKSSKSIRGGRRRTSTDTRSST